MKKSWWIVIAIIILLCPAALACSTPTDGKTFTESQNFCNKNYYLPKGITIGADNITINCNNAVLQGSFKETGITAKDRKNIVLKNCHIANYNTGILLINTTGAKIHDNSLLRNMAGIRLEQSSQNYLYQNRDVSITQEIKSIFSTGNHVRYTNKNIKGEFCRHNSCNENTPEKSRTVVLFQQNTLSAVLQEAIKKWISMG